VGGGVYSLALKSDGTVVSFNSYSTNSVPASLANVVQVSAGSYTGNLALKSDGTVVSFSGSSTNSVPDSLTNVVQVSAGQYSGNLALKSDGTVVSFSGSSTNSVPASLTNVVQVSAGPYGDHLALKSDGTVVSFIYSYTNSVPASLANVVQVSAGSRNNLALKSDGMVVSFYSGSYITNSVPASLTNVVQVSAGSRNNLALKSDGTVVSFSGSSTNSVPASLTNVVQVSAGSPGNLAIKSSLSSLTSQTINPFTTIPTKMYGSAPFTVTAPTANSGLPVTLSVVSGPATILGNTVTLTGVGTVVLAANQSGNGSYSAATQVTTSFQVNMGSQTIGSFTSIPTRTYGDAPFTVTAPAATSGLTVALSVVSGPATILGNTVTLTGVGTVVLAANQAGNGSYSAAPQVTTSFRVNMGSQSIAKFSNIPDQKKNTSFALSAPLATSGLPVTVTVRSGPATIANNRVTLKGPGIVQLEANQAGNANYTPAVAVTCKFVVK
jgi:hypothetical protein